MLGYQVCVLVVRCVCQVCVLGYQVCVSVGLSSVCVGLSGVCVGLSSVCECWIIKCVCWLSGVCVGLSGVSVGLSSVCVCWLSGVWLHNEIKLYHGMLSCVSLIINDDFNFDPLFKLLMIYDYALVLEVESPAGWGHTSAGGGVSSWVGSH